MARIPWLIGFALASFGFAACADDTESLGPEPDDAVVSLAPQQLRLLTRREYESSVQALLFPAPAPAAEACAVDTDCDWETASCVAGSCVPDPCNLVTFALPASELQYGTVVAAGSFNGWATSPAEGALPLSYRPEIGAWVGKHVIADGTSSYKLVADGTVWLPEPGNPNTEPDGFGGVNSLLTLSCDGAPPVESPNSDAYSSSFPVESRPEHYPFDNASEAGLVTSVHIEQYLRASSKIAERATADMAALLGCEATSADDPCVEAFIDRFGRRVLRRPLTSDERSRYAALVAGQPTLEAGMRVFLRVLLVSPDFLYRSEIGVPIGGVAHLTAWEIATLLSYSFWGSTPDDELLDAAENGELDDPSGIELQARRLLDDARAADLMGTFALQWLGVERVVGADKNGTMFPDFDRELSQQMAEETKRFVAGVILGSGRFEDLFTGETTSAAPRLAALYGADANGLLPDARRVGVLAHGSVLAGYAYSDQTSPVRRGLFVRTRLMCMELGAPPANAGSVPAVDPNSSTRDRFAQHAESPSCAACHRHIDPLGFAFESFDAVGAWRDNDAGHPIDSSGELTYPEGWDTDAESIPFANLRELGAVLAKSKQVKRCFVRQAARFVGGRLEAPEAEDALADLEQRFEVAGYDPKELFVALTQAEGFVKRRAQ